jgi:hypothetical protein
MISHVQRLQGPDVGEQLSLLTQESGDVAEGQDFKPLTERMAALKAWVDVQAA